MSIMLPKEWMTIREIAALKFDGLPSTKDEVLAYATSNNWYGEHQVRYRKDGVVEFHLSNIPPEAVKSSIEREEARRADIQAKQSVRSFDIDYKQWRPVIESLPPRKRRIVEARLFLITGNLWLLQNETTSLGQAIEKLRELLLRGRATDKLKTAAETASERGGIPSRTVLYAWHNALSDFGVMGLVPKDKRSRDEEYGPFLDRLLMLDNELPASPASSKRVRRCASLIASMSHAERRRAFDLNAPALRRYAQVKGWKLPPETPSSD